MRLSLDLTGAERPAALGARLAAVAAGAGDDAAAFDISALLLPLLAVQSQPQPAPTFAFGESLSPAAPADDGEPAVAKKTLPLMFLRPDFDTIPLAAAATDLTEPTDMKADAPRQEVEPGSAKPLTLTAALGEPAAPDESALALIVPAAAAEPVAMLPPVARQSTPVEHHRAALDAPPKFLVAAVERLQAQLPTAAVTPVATEVAKGEPAEPAASVPMLMAEVAHEAPKRAAVELQASAERNVKPLTATQREPERRVPLKGEPAPAVAPHEGAAVVRPAVAAHQTSADHDAQRAVRIITNHSSLVTASESPSAELPGASMSRTTLSELPSRLIESMRMQISAGGGHAEIRLSPEFLGAVKVSIVVDHGSVKATLTAETPAALEALRGDIGRLRDALEERGLRLDEFELREDPAPAGQHPGGESHAKPEEERQHRQPRGLRTPGAPEFGDVLDVVA